MPTSNPTSNPQIRLWIWLSIGLTTDQYFWRLARVESIRHHGIVRTVAFEMPGAPAFAFHGTFSNNAISVLSMGSETGSVTFTR
jgi:hypothetical protein